MRHVLPPDVLSRAPSEGGPLALAPELEVVVPLEEALRGAEGLKGKDRAQVGRIHAFL